MAPTAADAIDATYQDAARPASAVWMPACFDHTSDLCMATGPTVGGGGGLSYRDALREWFFEGKHRGALLADRCPEGDPTCNPTCRSHFGCSDSYD